MWIFYILKQHDFFTFLGFLIFLTRYLGQNLKKEDKGKDLFKLYFHIKFVICPMSNLKILVILFPIIHKNFI